MAYQARYACACKLATRKYTVQQQNAWEDGLAYLEAGIIRIYGQLVKLSEGRFRQMRIPMQQLFVSSAELNHRTFNGCYYIKKVVLFGEVRRKIPGELQVKKKN